MYSAIFSRTYPMRNIAAVLDAVSQDGYKGVQANLSSTGVASLPDALPAGVAAEIGSEAARRNLRIAALSGSYNMAHPDATIRTASREGFRNVLKAAGAMGAPVVTLCSGSRDPGDMWRFHPGNAGEDAWKDFRTELAFALQAAEDQGVSLAVEPEPANVIRDAKAASRLLKETASPRLGIVLDAANLLSPATLSQQSVVMAEALELLGGSVLLAHAKDMDCLGRVTAPGEGAVDLVAFARLLRAVGFRGALVAHGFPAGKTGAAAKALDRILTESA